MMNLVSVLFINIERLLELNDLINTVLNNYDCFVNGKDGKKPVVVPTKSSTPAPSSSVNIPESKNGPICLIDFDDVPSQQASSYSPPRQAAKDLDLLSDFASLNFSVYFL